MKKTLTALLAAALLMITLAGSAFAAGEYADIRELFSVWESEGYPDWVCGVRSTDGSADSLTVILLEGREDEETALRASLRDDSSLTVLGGGKYSMPEMQSVLDEITAEYGAVEGFTGCGIGLAIINGELSGFGESGLESRVVVSFTDETELDYASILTGRYGDIVYVEGGAAASTDTSAEVDLTPGGIKANIPLIMGVSAAALAAFIVICALIIMRRYRGSSKK